MGEIAEASVSFSLMVENDGDETGLVLKLLNNGSEKAYLTQIVCKNKTTGQMLTISTSSSEIELNASGGYLLLNTKTGEKSVQSYTNAGKAKTDYLPYVGPIVSGVVGTKGGAVMENVIEFSQNYHLLFFCHIEDVE